MSDSRGFVRTFMALGFLFSSMISVNAQVLVHEEPKHHPVLVNEKIRILDVVMAPGDSSIYHIHHTPSLFIFFTNSTTGSMLLGGTPSEGETTAGELAYENLSEPNTRTHRVWNLSKDTFHVMDIELLGKDSGYASAPLAAPGLSLEIDTAWSRAYKLTLQKGATFTLNEKDRAFVLVSFSKARVQASVNGKSAFKELRAGSFFDVPKGNRLSLQNKGEQTMVFAVMELPSGQKGKRSKSH